MEQRKQIKNIVMANLDEDETIERLVNIYPQWKTFAEDCKPEEGDEVCFLEDFICTYSFTYRDDKYESYLELSKRKDLRWVKLPEKPFELE